MADFKMSVKIGEIELKLEGEYEDVVNVFADVKESGIGKLNLYGENVPQNRNIISQPQIETNQPLQIEMTNNENQENSVSLQENNDIPSLEEIKIKDMPKGEVEWILVYSSFASDFGSKEFAKTDIVSLYKDNGRYSGGNRTNFSTNLKKAISPYNYIKPITKETYILTETGKQHFKNLISGKRDLTKVKQKRTKTKINPNITSCKIIDLGLSTEEIGLLKQNYEENKDKLTTGVNKTLYFIYWLKKHKNVQEVEANTIYSLQRIVSDTKLFDIPQTFKNMSRRNGFLTQSAEHKNKYSLNAPGEAHLLGKILKA